MRSNSDVQHSTDCRNRGGRLFRYTEPVDHHLGGRDRSQGNHPALAGIAGIPPLSRPDVDRCKTCVKDFGARRI